MRRATHGNNLQTKNNTKKIKKKKHSQFPRFCATEMCACIENAKYFPNISITHNISPAFRYHLCLSTHTLFIFQNRHARSGFLAFINMFVCRPVYRLLTDITCLLYPCSVYVLLNAHFQCCFFPWYFVQKIISCSRGKRASPVR